MILHVQGLRGIAIIAVLLFHLWPLNFPNGYIGVDMFFVLSGYLMAMIFSKHEKISFQIITEFYCKRVKRIFPLYYLIVPLILLFAHIFLNLAWIGMNIRHALYSMVLFKNMQTVWDKKDYFQGFQSELPSKDLFLHTWSLAVEIQFYLVVPFIFLILSFFPKFLYKIVILTGISIISCAYYFYCDPNFAFNFPLCRLWQFCLGMIAFLAYKRLQPVANLNCKEAKENKPTQRIAETMKKMLADWSILMAIILLWPMPINNAILRPLFTVITACLLVCESGMTSKILQHTWLTKIGDVSYTLYLVHWPVIVLFKRESFTSYQLCIGLIFFISIVLYMFYEEFYRKLSMSSIFVLLILLFAVNAGIYCSAKYSSTFKDAVHEFQLSKLDPAARTAVEQNYLFTTPEYKLPKNIHNSTATRKAYLKDYPWGIYDFEKGWGDKKVLVIGNSYAIYEGHLIHEEFRGNYSDFRVIAVKGAQIIYSYNNTRLLNKAMKLVEEYNPDIIFVTIWLIHLKDGIYARNISDDYLVREYNENIARLEANGAKVFIQGYTPLFSRNLLNLLIDGLMEGTDIEKLHLDKEKADKEMTNGKRRLAAIKCKQCEIIDTTKAFLEGNKYLAFDRKTRFGYVDNTIHYTREGCEKVRPLYRKAIESL